jgi:chromosome segregation ATPase
MEDAECENKQLKQEKFLISTKIGSALGAVNREVEQLRLELQKQDRRLIELNSHGKMKDISTENYSEELRQTKAEKAEIQAKYEALNSGYQELSEKSKNFDRLSEQVRSYKDDIARANETINCINNERRRLKSEKHDLLGQLKEAYCIIEDKESELRDFITNYEAKMRESKQRVENITNEKEKWLEEKRLMANTTPTQITQLKRVVDEKDGQLKELHTELAEVKDQLTKLQQTLNYPVPKSDKQQVKRSPVPTIKIHDSGILSNSERVTTEGMCKSTLVL